MEVPVLKSQGLAEVVMPAVKNHELKQLYEEQQQQDSRLKPFHFAHGFDVEITPEKDGYWFQKIDGYDVWRIKIRSAGAYSLNLIFTDFLLPEGSRLYIINKSEDHFLGAFTPANNKKSGKFAVSPVAGDEVTVQYEVPSGQNRLKGFGISQINHDYVGILKFSDRRPLGKIAGLCNLDVNCDAAENWYESKDAVCRIIVNGREICSGVLVNNTAENERPFILSAAHCYDKPEYAETSVFTFNYESPYCAPLDGDPVNSVSGASMKAFSDSLDFSLVELSLIPPPDYRPYFSGWDRSSNLPDSTSSIHHPQGDIKKIAIDSDPPIFSDFNSDYTPNGFLRVRKWEAGVTEQGSSGAPLFNPSGNVIGNLTGGNATCNNPVNDYFSRFDLAWEYKADSSGQLKYWLDPLHLNKLNQPGKRFYVGEDFCMAFTNLEDADEHQKVILSENGQDAGYWGGSNNQNVKEFVERFSVSGDEQLYGISIGIGLIDLISPASNSDITIKVYNGRFFPETLIYSQKVLIKNLVEDAMNFIGFERIIEPADTFFVGFELSNIQKDERFVIYQSLRQKNKENFFWFKQNNSWYDFESSNSNGYSIANVMELVACNVNEPDKPLVKSSIGSLVYPNPAKGIFVFEAGQEIFPENIKVYNLIGQEVRSKFLKFKEKKIQIDLSGNQPGVYFIRYTSKLVKLSDKVVYIPW